MKRFLLALFLICCAAPAVGQDIVVTTTVSAQDHAAACARSGRLSHCRVFGGLREGVGFSSAGPQQALESCCFWNDAMRGRYKIVEKGVARGPRGWFAVVRYR